MYIRTNILNRKFGKCCHEVKVRLFKTYCLCFYDTALWQSYTLFRSCYNKCLKIFFGYKRRDSLTRALLVTGLPSFDTVLCNAAMHSIL